MDENDPITRFHQEVTKDTSKRPEASQTTTEAVKGIAMNEQYLGDTLDEFLEEEGLLAEAEAIAVKRVIAYQITQLMTEQQLSKAEMARRMDTSRAAVDRLLDPENESATLTTLEKAAIALGKRLQVALV